MLCYRVPQKTRVFVLSGHTIQSTPCYYATHVQGVEHHSPCIQGVGALVACCYYQHELMNTLSSVIMATSGVS